MVINILQTYKWLYSDTASYIHTHNIGDNFISQISGKSYHASRTGMHIRHYPYLTVFKGINRDKSFYLFHRCIFNIVCKDFYIMIVYCLHKRFV